MCLSIVCLGAGLAQAAREPTNTFLTRQAVAQSARIPIVVFADEEIQPDVVAQAEQGDAVVPPVKRQRPVTPSDTPSGIPAPQAPPLPAPPQEATPAAGTAQEKPEPSPAEGTKQNAEDMKPPTAPAAAEKESVQAPSEPDASSPIFPEIGGIFAPITDWLASANRDYQNTVVKELSRPSDGAAPEQSDQAAKEAKEAQAAEEARQAQAARERDAAAKAQAAARAAAEAKAKAQSEAARAAAEAEAAKRAQQSAQSKAQKPAEDSAEQAAAKARRAEEQRQAEAARRAEQARKDEEDRKARDEAEARKLREAARIAEERRKQLAEEEARKTEAARAARLAAQERRAAAEAEQSAARAGVPNQTEDQPEPDGAPPLRHRRWAVTITAEPIGQELAEPAAGVLISNQRLAPRMSLGAGSLGGTRVKGWSWHAGRCSFAGRRVRLPGRYTVAKGDSLWRISQKHYDTGRLYKRIYRANRRQIADPDLIYPCQKFKVPRR